MHGFNGPHFWPESYGRRSIAFKQGYSSCREWLLDGVPGVSINIYDEETESYDAWTYGWNEAFRMIALQTQGGFPIILRQVIGLTDAGKKKFDIHLEKYGDHFLSREDHYRALTSVINEQLAGQITSRLPPWLWEPSAPEGKEGGCYSYYETDLIMEVIGKSKIPQKRSR
jgi:hypothetical protein